MSSVKSILIVEDDPAMLRILRGNFEFSGFAVETACDGEEALRKFVDRRPDLILLDIMLPKMDGHEVCQVVREDGPEVPIIMLTAKGQEADIVRGLNLGADDYVTKPFSIKELLARVNAVLRRRNQGDSEVFQFGDCSLYPDARKLLRKGEEVTLTPKELGLLQLFIQRRGRAMTRDQILNAVWGRDIAVTARSVDSCVNTLREKVESDPRRPVFIKTVRSIGYRFEIPEGTTSKT
jgi:two-component system, OmpR family, alkaline phosphatase synthesis response regulator PhoP